MNVNPELLRFLSPYDESIQNLTLQLREFIIDSLPSTNELIWDNYNAVAIAYSKSDKLKDAFCHLAVYPKHVNFGFNRGTELSQQLVPLLGTGKRIRHIRVNEFCAFPKNEMRTMLLEAIKLSEKLNGALIDPVLKSTSLVMSISEKKRR